MRLIDADALNDMINRSYPMTDRIDVHNGYAICQEMIKQLPTIEERKRGRWEMKPDPYGFFEEIPVCSECGCTTKMRETYKFCPNCGADMRGENNGQLAEG